MTIMLIIGCGVLIWYALRCVRLRWLQQQVNQRLTDQALDSRLLIGHSISRPEQLTLAAMTSAELLWHWASIDPQVIAAADFSSTLEINNGWDYANFVHQQIDGLSGAQLQGFSNRLQGYIGEQRVTELLEAQGQQVEEALTANQPIWDLQVNDQAINVKTVQDIASIKETALAHPDVMYIVPEDAAGEAGDNIVRLADFNHAAVSHQLHQSIEDAHGSTAFEAMGVHLPLVSMAFSLHRNAKAVDQGRHWHVAAQHVVIDTATRGIGTAIGAGIGGTIGSIIGPIGTMAGAVAGGVIGGYFSAQLGNEIKQLPLKKALDAFETQLQAFGAVYSNRLDRVIDVLKRPYQRKAAHLTKLSEQLAVRQRGLRWWVWPDFYTVALQEAQQHGRQHQQRQQEVLNQIEQTLRQADGQQNHQPLGLIMLNVPEMREILGVDLIALRQLAEQREQVYLQRTQLDPARFPPRRSMRSAHQPQSAAMAIEG